MTLEILCQIPLLSLSLQQCVKFTHHTNDVYRPPRIDQLHQISAHPGRNDQRQYPLWTQKKTLILHKHPQLNNISVVVRAANNCRWGVVSQLLVATTMFYMFFFTCSTFLYVPFFVFVSVFLSASLNVSKRGTYWDRLCRDVVGWFVVGWFVVGCHARALWPNGAS